MQDTPLNDIRIGQASQHWAKAQNLPVRYFVETDSTNLQAKNEAFSETCLSEHVVVYFADHQTAGRGRGQNTWVSPRIGSQLLSTWSFMIEQALLPVVSPLVGLALYKAAVATWPFLDWNLKAPNDLFIAGKKVAGLLLETVSQGNDHRLLVGLGFNVTVSPPLPQATSLVQNLTVDTPLLGQDWISFLERLVFEMSLAIQMSFEELNTTSRVSLLAALNQHPLLEEDYTGIDEQANLKTDSRQISWTQL